MVFACFDISRPPRATTTGVVVVEYYCFFIIIIVEDLETRPLSKVDYFLMNNDLFNIEKSKPSLFPRKTMGRQIRVLVVVTCLLLKRMFFFVTIPLNKSFFHNKLSFAKSQTKYCFFQHHGLGGAGRWNVVFCNMSNEILLFQPFFVSCEIDQKHMFCNKSNEILLLLLSFSVFFFLFCFWTSSWPPVLQQV